MDNPVSSAAPPEYSSVVTEEEAEQRNNNTADQQPAEDLSGIMERPLMAFVQEFRFRPPPVYSEVSDLTLLLLLFICSITFLDYIKRFKPTLTNSFSSEKKIKL